jgi:hypothetical protein
VIENGGNVGIGTITPSTKLTVEGTITLKEQADANADTAAYGQLWVNTATPNELYFTTDAGDDIQLTSGTSAVGGSGDLLKTDLIVGEDTTTCVNFAGKSGGPSNTIIFKVDSALGGVDILEFGDDVYWNRRGMAGIYLSAGGENAPVSISTEGARTTFIGNQFEETTTVTLQASGGLITNPVAAVITDSASVGSASEFALKICQGFIHCTGGGADTWTLPTAANLLTAITTNFYQGDSAILTSDHKTIGMSFTTYVINRSGGTLTYAVGSGGTLQSITGTLTQTDTSLAQLDFIFTNVTASSEAYYCLLISDN